VLREFENGLANALGTRLPSPLAGNVDVTPGRDVSRVVVRVRAASPIERDLLTVRPERVPGAANPRRVLRLRCEIELSIRVPDDETRVEAMTGHDAALYLLGSPAFADGSVMLPTDDTDPGFVIQQMGLIQSTPPNSIVLQAEGFFWPVGVAGQSGPAILAVRLRQALQPLRLAPERPVLAAAGAPVDFNIEFGGASGTFEVETGGAVSRLPFGSIVVSVVDAGGRPGAGALTGGADGPDGARVLAVENGVAALRYTPPAQAAVDHLVVRIENNEGGPGVELARFRLPVRSS
jgi:hypothetical protein